MVCTKGFFGVHINAYAAESVLKKSLRQCRLIGNRAAGHVRSEIAKRMHIRKSPAFRFIEDDGAAYAAHINKILGELHHD